MNDVLDLMQTYNPVTRTRTPASELQDTVKIGFRLWLDKFRHTNSLERLKRVARKDIVYAHLQKTESKALYQEIRKLARTARTLAVPTLWLRKAVRERWSRDRRMRGKAFPRMTLRTG